MKKIIIISSLMLCAIVAMRAQENTDNTTAQDERSKLHLGIKAGLNYSNVYDEKDAMFHTNPKYGFAGGVFLSIPIGKYLGVRPEALISQKGFSGKGMYMGTTYNISRTTTYLDVPLLIELKPIKYITVVGGPQYSYLLNQTDLFTNGSSTSAVEQDYSNDNVRKNILGATIGLDLNISRLVFGARYSIDMQNNNGDGSSTTPRYKNEWLQGTVGVRF